MLDMGSLLNMVLGRHDRMSATTQVWLFVAILIISGVQI